ncbi:hypothetical protein PoMZ_06146 [Pyricularia oryzae]|uniref:Uncharacterized protein n=1 Tax=Pyricularia oryzae TaxID=318829 RepID=A0A4V1C7S9_PYROR|nr:hypothetical protein PoMZ_06146 [Pyricularia oryzae]
MQNFSSNVQQPRKSERVSVFTSMQHKRILFPICAQYYRSGNKKAFHSKSHIVRRRIILNN